MSGVGTALGIPALYKMIVSPFLGGNTPVDTAINSTYGKIPLLGKFVYGAPDAVTTGIQKIRDPGVRSQLMRTNSGLFSPKGTMHGSEAVKHHLMSNITAAPADANNPLFKSIREMSTNPDTAKAYQRAVEEGRTAYVNFDPQSRDRMMRGLSKKQKASVKKQNDEFLDAMVGAGTYGWRR
jgi:hypothetical protein